MTMLITPAFDPNHIEAHGFHFEHPQTFAIDGRSLIQDPLCLVGQYSNICAGNVVLANASRLEMSYHYTGSHGSMGGAASWPHLRLDVSLPQDSELLAEQLASDLTKTIDEFMTRHQLKEGDHDER
jgi:hypothetical protein